MSASPCGSLQRLSSAAIVLSLLIASGVPLLAQGDRKEAAPALSLILERDALLANDAVPLEIWLSNPTDKGFEDVRLSLGAPAFIRITAGDCTGVFTDGEARIGPLSPGSIYHCRARLAIDPRIVEGNLTLSFALRYRRPGVVGESLLLQEKKVSVSLFGNWTIAGVDLSRVAYLLPGLLFLLLLRVASFPGIERLQPAEATAAAVIFSTVMLLAGGFLGIERREISRAGFAGLCLVSLVLAFAFALPWIRRKMGEKQRAKLLIQSGESPIDALRKAFEQKQPLKLLTWFRRDSVGPAGPVLVQLKGGRRLWGSIAGKTPKGFRLFGWYTIDPGSDKRLRHKLGKLLDRQDLPRILAVAEKRKLALTSSLPVCEVTHKYSQPRPSQEKKASWELTAEEIEGEPAVQPCPDLDGFPVRLAGSRDKEEAPKNYHPSRLTGDVGSAVAGSQATPLQANPV